MSGYGQEEFESFPRNITIAFVDEGYRVSLYVDTRSGPPRQILGTAADCRHEDGYRWYQAFSVAFVTCLGWSPILRDAMGLKRRGRRELEKGEDGVRAQMIEEYVIALLISDVEWVDGVAPLSDDLLSEIEAAVRGLEVDATTRPEWLHAIETGRRLWKALRQRGRSLVLLDTIESNLTVREFNASTGRSVALESYQKPLGFERVDLDEMLELVLIEVKPGVAELFRPLREGGWVNIGSKAEEWSRDLSDGFRWHDAFHLVNLTLLSWSPVAASMLGLTTSDLRPQLLEEAIIARAYRAFLDGSADGIRTVAETADRLCGVLGNLNIGAASWEAALWKGWELTRYLNEHSGSMIRIDQSLRAITLEPVSPR